MLYVGFVAVSEVTEVESLHNQHNGNLITTDGDHKL